MRISRFPSWFQLIYDHFWTIVFGLATYHWFYSDRIWLDDYRDYIGTAFMIVTVGILINETKHGYKRKRPESVQQKKETAP